MKEQASEPFFSDRRFAQFVARFTFGVAVKKSQKKSGAVTGFFELLH